MGVGALAPPCPSQKTQPASRTRWGKWPYVAGSRATQKRFCPREKRVTGALPSRGAWGCGFGPLVAALPGAGGSLLPPRAHPRPSVWPQAFGRKHFL